MALIFFSSMIVLQQGIYKELSNMGANCNIEENVKTENKNRTKNFNISTIYSLYRRN